MELKPQDFLVALKLAAWGERRWTYAQLAQALGLSASQAHASVKRGLLAGLLVQPASALQALPGSSAEAGSPEPTALEPQGIYRVGRKRAPSAGSAGENLVRPHSHNLAEFALHGAKYAFPGVKKPTTVGVPMSHSAPAFEGVFAPGSSDFVWPHPNGSVRGVGVEPLHPCVPYAAAQDAKLYEMLALFDALRVGRARERGMALERLQLLIDPNAPQVAKGAARG